MVYGSCFEWIEKRVELLIQNKEELKKDLNSGIDSKILEFKSGKNVNRNALMKRGVLRRDYFRELFGVP